MPLVFRTDATISVGAKSTTLPPRLCTARAGITMDRNPIEPRNATFSRSMSEFFGAARNQVHLQVHNRSAGDVHAPIQRDACDAAAISSVEISIAFFLFLSPTAGEPFVPAADAPAFGAATAG